MDGMTLPDSRAIKRTTDSVSHRVRKFRERIQASRDAAHNMLCDLWRPVVATTLVICVGFSVMNFADLIPFHTFSRLLSATMIYALLGDLLLLPALLIAFDKPGFNSFRARLRN